MTKNEAVSGISGYAAKLTELSDAIWDHPEVKYHESFACSLLSEFMQSEGFTVVTGCAGIPTAFTATFGAGRPHIGLLGEYDALDSMSQVAEADTRCPVAKGAPGHGCGHNLLSVGSVGAALLVRDYLKAGHSGTVTFFGCPAEEGGSGKTFMAREGIFDDLDTAVTWHPGDTNSVANGSNLANIQVAYHFKGKAAHAAISPDLGRSALDAIELMNMGIQFLREHVPDGCRIHYAITNTGGNSPNVVQAEADGIYLMRAKALPVVRSIKERIDDIARGAALMTGTKVEIEFIKACSNVMPNKVLVGVMQKNLEEYGSADYDDADRALAKKMRDSMEDRDDYYFELVSEISDPELRERLLSDRESPIYNAILPCPDKEECGMASSDVGDVSWICPTVQCSTVTMPGGTVMHSWQEVAVGKSTMAHKGMLQASKIMAGTVIDALEDPSIIEASKAELTRRTGGAPYVCPIPKDVPVPLNL